MNTIVSIIVPVYNVSKYLKICLDSIQKQTYKYIEVILVNDGSTDNSLDICNEYVNNDDRFKVITQDNQGLSSARNTGLKNYTGQYVFFVDSDDYIKENTIELLLNKAIDNDSDLVCCDMEYLYDDNHTEFTSGGDFIEGNVKDKPSLLFINNTACNKLIHTSILGNFDFPHGLWYEDLASIPLLLAKAKHIVKLDEVLYVYYQREGSIAHSADKRIFDIYKAIKMLEDKLGDIVKPLYIIHGLDLTTLRIKDFSDKSLRKEYLNDNMNNLYNYYPGYKNDKKYKEYGIKKKLIFSLLEKGMYDTVLKLYDK